MTVGCRNFSSPLLLKRMGTVPYRMCVPAPRFDPSIKTLSQSTKDNHMFRAKSPSLFSFM